MNSFNDAKKTGTCFNKKSIDFVIYEKALN